MKTLKKTLCLVLAVVLAVGVLVIPAYAETDSYNSFTDKDDVDYKYEEALATLTGMGIFNGKSSTSASPKASLTRAEAVTLIARALLGEGDWTLPKAPTQFSDVPASHYASGYVAYATEQGIVAGKSRTTFAPNDLVTGYELAKMLLVATGIKTNFTAAKWQMESGPLASQKGLLVGLEGITDLNKPLTREEAAQLIWNAVKYSETLSFVVTDPNKKDYTVKFPEDSIGGRVFGLTAHYSYDNPSTGVDSDVFNRPNVEWSNGKTGAEKEVYSNITQRPLVQFYAGATLTVNDLLKNLGLSSGTGRTYKVYIDGNLHSDGANYAAKDLGADGKTNILSAPPASTRGAEVSIYPGTYGNVTYDVYVVYPYASALKTAPNDGVVDIYWNHDAAGTSTTHDSVRVGSLKKGDVVTFNVSTKENTEIVNLKSEAAALNGKVTARNNNDGDPYIRIDYGKKLYFSANAVVITKSGDDIKVSDVEYTDAYIGNADEDLLAKYYNVWFDDAGNILALQKTDGPVTALDFDDYGYVLEFSTAKGTQSVHVHENEYGENKASKAAQAKVTMVSLKTGIVQVYDLKVVEKGYPTAETWYLPGLDNNVNESSDYKIDSDLHAVTNQLHGFVAYKKVDGGYIMSTVDSLNTATTKYSVIKNFVTASSKPGRVDVTLTDNSAKVWWADDNSELFVLDNHKTNADGSMVTSYDVTTRAGYRNFGSITAQQNDTCLPHGNVADTASSGNTHHIGTNGLFVIDAATNTVKTAYIFKEYVATVMNDLWIFLGRGESVDTNTTMFNFIHNGEEVSVPMRETDPTKLFTNIDASKYPVVNIERNAAGELINMTPVNTTYELQMNKVGAFVVNSDNGGFIAQDSVLNGDPINLNSGWYVFDAATGKVATATNGSLVGKNVYVYYADPGKTKIAIIWVETNPAKHG